LPVVLTNGLGGDYRAWKHILERFGDRDFATWDYRGLYRSEAPRTPGSLSPQFQALDLQSLLDHLGWPRAVVVGWSMGVQVNFEAWRRMPTRVAGIGVVNGVAGRPFDTALGSRLAKYVIPAAVKRMRRHATVVGRVSSLATSWKGLLPLMVKLGFVGATVDMTMFAEFARTFASLDFDLYGATLQALGRHDAHDVLPGITVPVRIVTGDKDLMTPVATAKHMQSEIRSSTLRILVGGTHYTPVEYPREVGDELSLLFAAAAAEASAA
jgi:pimeloyl-ACP methyl ester carboxylesterase